MFTANFKLVLRTGLVSSASGSAYLELELPRPRRELFPTASTIKLSCTVHGPKPVSRTSYFSPNLQLTASVKFAPFATRLRRGYVRDASERDLGTHLETALRGAIIPNRWPKSAIDVVVIVLEGEEDHWVGRRPEDRQGIQGVGMMNVLAGCITVASAALADARIDCIDLLAGGVAAIVASEGVKEIRVLDPCPMEHEQILSACTIGYLPTRDEITEVWMRGNLTGSAAVEDILEGAVKSARGTQLVLQEAVQESAERWTRQSMQAELKKIDNDTSMNDVEMKT